MYLWRKRASQSWLSAHARALARAAGDKLVVIERPDRRLSQLEVASAWRVGARRLTKQFGGRIHKLPRDWLKRCLRQQKTKALRIGGKALIIPAGAAFGTGEHGTTAMCLRLLERVMQGRGARTGRTRSLKLVVDLGTGSGILALAARRLGAKRAIGVDNDSLSISTAKQNARRNKIDNVQFQLGDVRRWKLPGNVEMVVANLCAELLIEILPKLSHVPYVIFSGILRDQEKQIARAIRRSKIDIVEVRRRGKWVAILGAAGVQ